METNQETMQLICDLEDIIGNHFVNSRTSKSLFRTSYRYPVSYRKDNSPDIKQSNYNVSFIERELNPQIISTMSYKVGANYLQIGKGIVDLLEELERRYGLDFNELEKEYQQSKRE